mgnify:CR=1 FL=1
MIGLYILISLALEYENKAFKFGMSMRLDKRWYDYSDTFSDPRYHCIFKINSDLNDKNVKFLEGEILKKTNEYRKDTLGNEYRDTNKISYIDFIKISEQVLKEYGINYNIEYNLNFDKPERMINENTDNIEPEELFKIDEPQPITPPVSPPTSPNLTRQETFNDRQYQLDIIEIGYNILMSLFKFYLELATGGGKSVIVFNIFKKIKPDTIVIFTPRKNINKQNISKKYLSLLGKSYNVYDNNSGKCFDNFYKQGKNIIVACIQSYEKIYEYLTTYDMGDVFIWFDEAHWMVENWTNVKNDGNIIIQYFLKNLSIKYRMFTSASPNHELIKRNESIFGQLCSPIKVKKLIKDKWLCPILPHIFETNSQNTNVIQYCLQHFTKYQKSWGFSFHNNCINAGALFKIHYELYKNKSTNIKPFIDVSNSKELDLSEIRLNYDYTDINVFERTQNSMAYVVQKYSMGYDFDKIDYITVCDPKSSYKDIIQCIGRGTRPDKLGENGTNLEKKLHIMLPIYMDQMEMDKSPYETISEVLRYLIYDIELDPLEDIEFVEGKKLGGGGGGTDYRGGDNTRAILLDLLKGGKYSSIKKQDLIQMLKDKDVHDNSSYYRLKENRPDLELPELFSAFPDFTFEETYDNSPYYSKQDCIEKIKNIMESNDIDGDDEDIDYYNEIDSKIPDQALFHFYGGCRNDYPCY